MAPAAATAAATMASPHGGFAPSSSVGGILEFEDLDLLRAARVADVLGGRGRMLASSAGSADTYELSSPVDRIDVFISHNWATGQRLKFVALAMHFNLDIACCAAVAALVVSAWFSTVLAKRYDRLAQAFPVVSAATVLAFFAVFFFGHEVQAAFGFRGKRAFLDKVCIHQTDMGLKERGIRSLGAFLHRSDSMFVCFTGLYLKRLWTVYEFATFLLVRGDSFPKAIHIMPASLPVLVLASSLAFLCATALWRALFRLDGLPIFLIANIVSDVFLLVMVTAGCRWWARRQDEARADFQQFALEHASCVSEMDRVLVSRNIVALMRHFCHVDPHVSDADVLQAFNEYVRTAGSRAFSACVGGLGVPYKLILPFLLASASFTIQNFTFSLVYPGRGFETNWQTALQLLGLLGSSFLMIPLVVALGLQLTKLCLALRGACEMLYCAGLGLIELAALFFLDPYWGQTRPWLLDAALERSDPLPFLLYTAGLLVATAVVYRKRMWKVGAPPALMGTASASAGAAPEVAKTETGRSAEGACEVVKAETSRTAEDPCEAEVLAVAVETPEVRPLGSQEEAGLEPAIRLGRIIGSGLVVTLDEP